jgi:hypothetical protein
MEGNGQDIKLTFGTERFGGTAVNVGGKTYVVPPMSLGALKRLRDPVRKILDGKATEEETQDTTVAVIYSSLKRNYPELTLEYVQDEIVDLSNGRQLLNIALNASGYVKSASSGNAEAGILPSSTS